MQTNRDVLVLFALCPLLGATQSLGAAIGLGLVVVVVVALAAALRLATRSVVSRSLQTAAAALLWAGALTAVDLSLQSWWPRLYLELGIFLPLLLATTLYAAAPHDAGHPPVSAPLVQGATFLGAAVLLGAARELTGQGSLFATGEVLLEPLSLARVAGLSLFEENRAFLIAIMPPGALIAAGLLLATRNAIRRRAEPGPGE